MTETESLDKYICQHIEPEGDYLYRLYRATNIHTIHGRMASGHIQGRLLKMLVEMIRPKISWKLEPSAVTAPSVWPRVYRKAANSTPLKSMMRWRISPDHG